MTKLGESSARLRSPPRHQLHRAFRPMGILFLALAVGLAAGAPTPSHADHGDGPKFRAVLSEALFTYPPGQCRIQAKLWTQEYGDHGVEQFKWKFWRFLGALNEASPDADYLRAIQVTSYWNYSLTFPGDSLSYFVYFSLDGTQPFSGHSVTSRAKVVGIRPSWWNPDYTARVQIGICQQGVDGVS
jgi:hypothetical protein